MNNEINTVNGRQATASAPAEGSALAAQAHDLLSKGNVAETALYQGQLNNEKPMTLDQLSHMDSATLSDIYSHCTAGNLPHGETNGKGIAFPGTTGGDVLSNIANKIWKGKVFEDNGLLENKILGHNLIKADVSKGESWSDGKESIIIDYKNKSLAASFIRDEIREVQPGLYLGKMYARLPFGQHADVAFFALEEKEK